MAEKETRQDETRSYTIPLRHAFRHAARYKKTNKAVRAVREFLKKHMKSDDVRLGQHLNAFLWARGIKHPPPRVTVTAVKDAEGVVRAALEGKAFVESVKPIPKEEDEGTLKEKLQSTFKKKDGEQETKDGKEAVKKPAPKVPAGTEEGKPAPKSPSTPVVKTAVTPS